MEKEEEEHFFPPPPPGFGDSPPKTPSGVNGNRLYHDNDDDVGVTNGNGHDNWKEMKIDDANHGREGGKVVNGNHHYEENDGKMTRSGIHAKLETKSILTNGEIVVNGNYPYDNDDDEKQKGNFDFGSGQLKNNQQAEQRIDQRLSSATKIESLNQSAIVAPMKEARFSQDKRAKETYTAKLTKGEWK